jgi:hypothetical protein
VCSFIACHLSLFLQREGAEDILDFWLDVQQHENLCRAYFKDVRKSGRTIKEDWPQYWDYARRRGSIYGTVVGMSPGGSGGNKRSTTSTGEGLNEQEKRDLAMAGEEKNEEAGSRSGSPRPPTPVTPGVMSDQTHVEHTQPAGGGGEGGRSTTPFSLSGRTPTLFNLKRASRAPTVIPRSSAITRMDLIASAERIFFRYLSPAGNAVNSSENHEIYLPPSLRIHTFPLSSAHEPKTPSELNMMAQIPDIYHTQKEYCFRAMEQDAYPRFLRAKAFGNLTPVSALVRLVAGLVILWIGLATGFSLIFLDIQPKSLRFFVSFAFSQFSFTNHSYVAALLAIRLCDSIPHFSSIRTRPHSRLSWPVRDYTFPYTADSRAVCPEVTARSRDMGQHTRGCVRHGFDSALLGSSWT